MAALRAIVLAAVIATPVPASAQAFRGFAGNLAMSRVTMQPVDAQRRRNLSASRGRFVASYGVQPTYRTRGSLSPVMRARVVAAVRRVYLQRMIANSARYHALAAR